jgi:hypothetical protein
VPGFPFGFPKPGVSVTHIYKIADAVTVESAK